MKRKLLSIVLGSVVLAVCGITLAQVPISPTPVPQGYSSSQAPSANLAASHTPTVKTDLKPDDLTIEQILDTVETIREQKAELEKKEKLYLKSLRKKTEKLKERIDRVDPDTSTSPAISSTPPSIVIPVSSVPPSLTTSDPLNSNTPSRP